MKSANDKLFLPCPGIKDRCNRACQAANETDTCLHQQSREENITEKVYKQTVFVKSLLTVDEFNPCYVETLTMFWTQELYVGKYAHTPTE